MEIQTSNSLSKGCSSEDLQEIDRTPGSESSRRDTEGASLGMVQEQETDTLVQDKNLFPSFEENAGDDEISLTVEFTKSLNSDGLDLTKNENIALDQKQFSSFEEQTGDDDTSFTDNTSAPELTESFNSGGFDFTKNKNIAKDQKLFSSFEEQIGDDEISLTGITCVVEFTESLNSDGFDLFGNENMALDQTMFHIFEEKPRNNEISLTEHTCRPTHELTASLNSYGFDLFENENVTPDQNPFPPFEDDTRDIEISLTENTCTHELTESLNSDGFHVTENENVALMVDNANSSTNETPLNDSVDLSEDGTQLDLRYLPNEDDLPEDGNQLDQTYLPNEDDLPEDGTQLDLTYLPNEDDDLPEDGNQLDQTYLPNEDDLPEDCNQLDQTYLPNEEDDLPEDCNKLDQTYLPNEDDLPEDGNQLDQTYLPNEEDLPEDGTQLDLTYLSNEDDDLPEDGNQLDLRYLPNEDDLPEDGNQLDQTYLPNEDDLPEDGTQLDLTYLPNEDDDLPEDGNQLDQTYLPNEDDLPEDCNQLDQTYLPNEEDDLPEDCNKLDQTYLPNEDDLPEDGNKLDQTYLPNEEDLPEDGTQLDLTYLSNEDDDLPEDGNQLDQTYLPNEDDLPEDCNQLDQTYLPNEEDDLPEDCNQLDQTYLPNEEDDLPEDGNKLDQTYLPNEYDLPEDGNQLDLTYLPNEEDDLPEDGNKLDLTYLPNEDDDLPEDGNQLDQTYLPNEDDDLPEDGTQLDLRYLPNEDDLPEDCNQLDQTYLPNEEDLPEDGTQFDLTYLPNEDDDLPEEGTQLNQTYLPNEDDLPEDGTQLDQTYLPNEDDDLPEDGNKLDQTYLPNEDDLPEDGTQLDETYLPNEDVLASIDLFSSKSQIILSDISPNSDSDGFPGQVLSPCHILLQEMSIQSPTMTSSFLEENSFFKTLFSENNMTDVPSGTEDEKIIDNVADNSLLQDDVPFQLSEHASDSKDMTPWNTKQQYNDQCSEQFFLGQILQRINTHQSPEMGTEIRDHTITDVCMDMSTSLSGENLQLNVWHTLNIQTGPGASFAVEAPQTAILSAFEFPPINSTSSSSESLVAESYIKDTGNLVNFQQKKDFTKNKSPFWEKNVKGHRVKADTPTISFLCEDYNDNYEIIKPINLPKKCKPERSTDSSESNLTIINGSLLRESSEQTADRESSVHDQMLNIVNEFRRLTARDDFDIHDLEFGLRDISGDPCSDYVSARTNVATAGSCARNNDLLVMSEIKEGNELSKESCSIDLMHDPSNAFPGKDSPNVDASVLLPDTASGERNNFPTIFENQTEYKFNSGILAHINSTPLTPLQEVSTEDDHLDTNDKENTPRAIFVQNGKGKKSTAVPYRGIFKTIKEKPEHAYPKRVSFRTDSSLHGTDHKSGDNMFKDNINVNDMGAERSDARRAAFNVGLQFSHDGLEYGRSQSFDMNKPDRFLDRFRRAKSFPAETEFYFPQSDASTERSDDMLLDFAAFDHTKGNEKINFVEKKTSLDDYFDEIDINNGFSEGATNLAFLLESPVAQSSLEDDDTDDDDEDDSSDEKEGIRKLFLPKDMQTQLQLWKLFEKSQVRRPVRQHSATELQEAATTRGRRRLRLWYSLDESVSETSSLTNSSTHVKKRYNEHVPSPGEKFSSPKDNKDTDETTFSSLDATEQSADNGKEEDTLSLEFFVPGKHKYIRLHRRTFIHVVLKYSIFFFTFLFWIASVSGLGYCSWMLTSNTVVIDDVSDVFLDPYVLLCFVCGTIFLVAFFGCVGAVRENICLLKLFHISLTAVLVLEVLLSSLVFLFYTMPEFRMVAKVGPEEVLKKAVKEYLDNEVLRKWIDMIQKEFQCCGVSMSNQGYLDWQENPYYNCSASNPSVYKCSVPLSCCIFMPGDYINYMCGAGVTKKEESEIIHIINTKGCMKSFGEWLGKNDAVMGYVALGVIVPQILGVIATRFFIKNLRARRASWQQLSDPVQIVTPS